MIPRTSDKLIQLRVTAHERDILQTAASEMGLSVAALVRYWINSQLRPGVEARMIGDKAKYPAK